MSNGNTVMNTTKISYPYGAYIGVGDIYGQLTKKHIYYI